MPHIKFCQRCNSEWVARTDNPRRCGRAGCKALYWDKPRRIPKVYPLAGPVGKPLKHPQLGDLLPGGRAIIRWAELPGGKPDFKTNATYSRSAFALAKRRGWTIRIEPSSHGLWVIRMS